MPSPKPLAAVFALAVLLPGCAGQDSSAPPAPPALGPQIDRMGRAGVNTAVTDPFNLNSAAKGANQDGYNAAGVPTQWAGQYAAPFAANLAILDSLDTVCGNQLLAGPAPVAGRFGCHVTQTINGKPIGSTGVFANPDDAVRGGLEDLRKALGW